MVPTGSGGQACPMTETGFSTHTEHRDWWSRRPRRSRTDSKVAGVAGGLAHYLGVDPILFRVGFVALTLLGGVGILAYAVLWLLLPAEGDEVSAGEALLGRGRSSVSPIVAAALAVAVVIGVFTTFSWGFPFWPALIIGAVAFHVARKQRRGPFRPGSEWERRIRATADNVAANRWSGGAGPSWGHGGGTGGPQGWGHYGGWGGWGAGCGGGSRSSGHPAAPQESDSPFDTPAFWDTPAAGDRAARPDPFRKAYPTATARPADPFRTSRAADDQGAWSAAASDGADGADGAHTAEPRTTPPAWDPLGAAPFAWDLPDIDLAPRSELATARRRTASPVIARATGGLVMLVIAVSVGGIFAGWWNPAWSAVAGAALAVVALGLLAQSLRGRSLTLIGPGVFLSLATLALSVTGISGTATAGDVIWTANQTTPLQDSYRLSAGNGTLDLTGLTIDAGGTVSTSVEVNAGQAKVLVPANVAVDVTCSSNAGQIDCLGVTLDGLNQSATGHQNAPGAAGTLELEVHVGAGNLVVTR